mmetsp:Transcript_68638/g.139087  ORF Transcript_68638/g.139087 Transcript_68638/m.139087 type:complete len:230 (-) Transcript_68638:459-1148(-)
MCCRKSRQMYLQCCWMWTKWHHSERRSAAAIRSLLGRAMLPSAALPLDFQRVEDTALSKLSQLDKYQVRSQHILRGISFQWFPKVAVGDHRPGRSWQPHHGKPLDILIDKCPWTRWLGLGKFERIQLLHPGMPQQWRLGILADQCCSRCQCRQCLRAPKTARSCHKSQSPSSTSRKSAGALRKTHRLEHHQHNCGQKEDHQPHLSLPALLPVERGLSSAQQSNRQRLLR